MHGYVWILAALLLAASGCGRGASTGKQTSKAAPPQGTDGAKELIQRGKFNQASQLIQDVLLAEPENAVALELAGDLAVIGEQPLRATEFFDLAVRATDQPSKHLLNKLGQQWMNAGRPFDSIRALEIAVDKYPHDPELRTKLVGLQSALGMQHESAQHLQWLVQRGLGGLEFLVILSDLNRPQTVESTCNFALKQYPQDLRPKYSLARLPAYHSKWSDVAQQLKPVVKRHPDFLPAQALYGRALVHNGSEEEIASWGKSLPKQIEDQADYWMAAGVRAQQLDDPERAAHAFWRAAELNENDAEALSRLAATLVQLGRDQQARAASDRAAKIAAIRDKVDSLISWRNNSQSAAVQIALILDELGRTWEATAWLQAAFRMTENKDPKLPETYKVIRNRLTGSTPWQLPERLVAAKLDLSKYPSIDWKTESSAPASNSLAEQAGHFRFLDQAKQRNLIHVCKLNKPNGKEANLAIYQSGAGGAGVIDFDLDGWPDLYLTNMNGTPKKFDSDPNQLFRNLQGQFTTATSQAGIGDRGFAQGVAVGDYNADGLADVLVANLGANQLYRNNGDGTFTNVTNQSGLTSADWTTSAAIVDLDADGHADIMEIGYCRGEKPLKQKCIDPKLGEARSCAPLAFDAQPDRVWRGRGDGTFIRRHQHLAVQS